MQFIIINLMMISAVTNFQINKNSATLSTPLTFCGIIPEKEIFAACTDFTKNYKNIKTEEELYNVASDFYFHKLLPLIRKTDNRKIMQGKPFLSWYRHELVNEIMPTVNNVEFMSPAMDSYNKIFIKEKHPNIVTDEQYLEFMKNKVASSIETIKEVTTRWQFLEKWADKTDKKVFVFRVLRQLKKTLNKSQINKFKFKGISKILFKRVENPFRFYNINSQLLLNADKYGEGKPVIVEVKKVVKDKKSKYYASYKNLQTKPVPDDQIDEIVKGEGHRSKDAVEAGIQGTGTGLQGVITALKEAGYDDYIPQLIKKGLDSGFIIEIPLIGIKNT